MLPEIVAHAEVVEIADHVTATRDRLAMVEMSRGLRAIHRTLAVLPLQQTAQVTIGYPEDSVLCLA